MALCAVNLAECAEEKIPPSTLIEIHLTAAMGLKTRCGGKLGFLAVSTVQFLYYWLTFPRPCGKVAFGKGMVHQGREGVAAATGHA